MSVKASAGYCNIIADNTNRADANPPIVFPGFSTDPGSKFSFSIWARMTAAIPIGIVGYNGISASYVMLGSDGISWAISGRHGGVGLPNALFANVTYNRWTLFCISKTGPTLTVYMGVEDEMVTRPYERPVQISQVLQYNVPMNEAFHSIGILLAATIEICNFKFWNHALTQAEFTTQANTWSPAGSPAPMWVSALRTSGDISNVANPYTSPNWAAGHAFTIIDPSPSNIITAGYLGGWNDPAYLAATQASQVWVYPIGYPAANGFSHIDPGLTPSSPTNYKSTVFFQFEDRGTVPHHDNTIQHIVHYGFPFYGPDPGPGPSDTWGLYVDGNEVETPIDLGDPNYLFTPAHTGAVVETFITATNMYLYKFGSQYRWQPVTPQTETARGNLAFQFLYVDYIGFPSGFPLLSEQDLSGLFVFDKNRDERTDQYHRAVNLKIPNPTIKTAFIGE